MRNTQKFCRNEGQGLAAVVLLAAAAGASTASADDLAPYKDPVSTVTLGFGDLGDPSRQFSLYNGLSDSPSYVIGAVDILRRDDETGSWLAITGRNLGLGTRELRIAYDRENDWGYFIDYSRFVRREPLLVTTGLAGIGTTSQVISGGPLRSYDFSIDRSRVALGLDKTLKSDFQVAVKFTQDDKKGERIFGRGTGQFLAEPLDSRTEQMEATVSYTGANLQLAGGYYASIYTNAPKFIDVATGADISLPLDNNFHQLYLSGGYSLPRTARINFKLAMGRAKQNENFFIAPDLPGNTRTNLDGRVDSLLAQAGFSMRPLEGLSLSANFRYEDRDDKTPRFQFLTASTGRDGFNTPFSRRSTTAKLEATYALPMEFRLTGGVDYDKRKRSVLSIRQASWREENDETTWRLELRRSLSATLNGALAYLVSSRGGSDYLPANNNAAADFIDPVHFADRARHKARLSLDWTPLEALSIQAWMDDSKDSYAGRLLGPEFGKARFYSVDAAYTFADNWQLNAWMSRDENRIVQSTISGANGTTVLAQTWRANLYNQGDAAGLGVTGKFGEKIGVGLDVQYEQDDSEYRLQATVPAAAALPDIRATHARSRIYMDYAARERLDLRFEYIHDRFKTNDWSWSGWVYADGSTVQLVPKESGHFIGLSARYQLR